MAPCARDWGLLKTRREPDDTEEIGAAALGQWATVAISSSVRAVRQDLGLLVDHDEVRAITGCEVSGTSPGSV